MELPIFLLSINEGDDTEVSATSFVDSPAIQKNWMMFNEKKLFFKDEDKRIVSGPLMLANFPIYRRDESGKEYYVVFNADSIDKIIQKYFRSGSQGSVNLMHSEKVEGVFMFESWKVDRALGKMPIVGYEDAEDGSWFGSFKVENDDVWAKVKSGEIRGFSVEGLFSYELMDAKITEEQALAQILQIVSNISI